MNKYLATSATSKEGILKQLTTKFLQWATSAMSKEQILQRVTSDFFCDNQILQLVTTSEIWNECRVIFCSERFLQRVTSYFFYRVVSNEWIFNEYRGTSEKLLEIKFGHDPLKKVARKFQGSFSIRVNTTENYYIQNYFTEILYK